MPARGELGELDVASLRGALASKIVIDARRSAEFARAHIPGSMSIPFGTSFATWAGTLLDPDR